MVRLMSHHIVAELMRVDDSRSQVFLAGLSALVRRRLLLLDILLHDLLARSDLDGWRWGDGLRRKEPL